MNPDRFFGLDASRGIAVLLMITYHLLVDLSFLGVEGPDPYTGLTRLFGIGIASSFIIIAGISAWIRGNKIQEGYPHLFILFCKRGLFILSLGLGITVVTWWYLKGDGYVVFGILHLIGIATILAPVFIRLGRLNVFPALLLIGLGTLLPYGPIWLIWIGVHPISFWAFDYTPLIPWLGIFLFGIALGSWIYPMGRARYDLSDRFTRYLHPSAFLGRYSLFIYLVHQPILITAISIYIRRSIF